MSIVESLKRLPLRRRVIAVGGAAALSLALSGCVYGPGYGPGYYDSGYPAYYSGGYPAYYNGGGYYYDGGGYYGGYYGNRGYSRYSYADRDDYWRYYSRK